jgi:hypothetical protein
MVGDGSGMRPPTPYPYQTDGFFCSWHKTAVRRRAEYVRSARVFQKSTCSAIAKASSTSMPRYLTVLSILVMSEQLDGPEISQIRKCEQSIEKVLSQEERDRPSGSLSIKMK